jgi:iron complex outermembrane receptor protein
MLFKLSRLQAGIALAALTVPALTVVAPAQAQVRPAETTFDIQAMPLNEALVRFSEVSGMDVIVDRDLVAGQRSAALRGSMSIDAALLQMLSGTGLSARVTADGAVIRRAATERLTKASSAGSQKEVGDSQEESEIRLRTVVVASGDKGDSVNLGGLGARSILDTPFSVSAVTSTEIADKVASTVDEILKGDSGVRTAGNGVAAIIPEVAVRGLLLDQLNSYKVDGLTFPNRSSLPVEHFSQVEVLKGLSGFMYGFGTPGGIVNYISKRPTDEDTVTLGAGFVSDATFKGSADVNVGIGANDAIGLRGVGVVEKGDTYVDQDGRIDRTSLSGSATFDLNDRITILADGLYNKRRLEGVIFAVYHSGGGSGGLPTTVPLLAPIDGRTNLAESGSYYETETKLATVGADFNIASDWKANVSYRFAQADANWREGNANLTTAAGDYIFREFTSVQTHRYNQVQGFVIGQFDTGPLEHEVTFGASWQELEQFNDRTPGTFNLVGTSNIYNPIQIPGSFSDPRSHDTFLTLVIDQQALFASDTITLGDFSLIAGARLNKFEQTNLNAAGATTATYEKTPLTPTVALRYKPMDWMTIYGSYVQSLEKGGQASVINANFGDIFGPLESEQFELGFKADRSAWSASMAAFRILRGAEYTNSSNVFVQDGEARYQGIEASATLRPFDGFAVTAQGMHLDAELVRGAVNVGKRIPGAAEWQGSLSFEYSPQAIEGLKLLAAVTHLGDSKLEANNLRTVPGFSTIDASARYTFGESRPITVNFGVRNIADERYWTIRNSGTPAVQQGAPRTVVLGVSTTF